MEEITLDDLFKDIEIPECTFSAVFDPDTGEVTGVGPTSSYSNCINKVEIDQETAELIIEGKISLSSCFVDSDSDKVEFVESKTVIKIDDLMHRIPEKQWCDLDKIDLYVVYYKKSETLKFQLSEEYGGTKKLSKKFQPVRKRKIKWDGNTVMNFLITDYNDPNIVHSTVSLSINDLIGKDRVFKNVDFAENHSIYTKRFFKNCVMEFK